MASIAASGIVLEPLTKDNYDNWSCLVRNYLAGHGLWEVVTSDSPVGVLSDEAYEIWNMKNAKALHIIQLACGSENLTHVRDVGTAKDAWNYFITAHDSESNTKESVVQSDIEQTKESIVQSDIEQGEVEVSLLDNRSLYWFIQSGNWNDANAFMKRDKTSMFSTSSSGRTILHVAVIAGHEEIVKKLVKKGKDKLVEMKDNRGYTALSLVAEFNGNINMTKCMVENKGEQVFGEDLLYMKTNDGKTPLLLAAARGHKEMTSYLYSHTNRLDEMADNNFHTCSMLFTLCINAGIFDVALNLLQQFPQMPLAFSSESRYEFDGVHPLYALSCMPYVFPSSSTYGLIQGFFYKVLRLPEEHNLFRLITTSREKQLKRYFAGKQ